MKTIYNDILMELSCLSQHLCYPREGCLDAVYRMFRYLQKNLGKNPGRMAYAPMYESTDDNVFEGVGRYLDEWKYFYPHAQEMMPRHMPEALVNYVVIEACVYAYHAGNMANSRLHSDIIIYVNNSPIIWYSKHQNTVEDSSFGSNFFDLRISKEKFEALRYKLRCFGIPVEVPAEVSCDNMSVVKNLSIPTSVLNKRHNPICYRSVREAQAAGILRVGSIPGVGGPAQTFQLFKPRLLLFLCAIIVHLGD